MNSTIRRIARSLFTIALLAAALTAPKLSAQKKAAAEPAPAKAAPAKPVAAKPAAAPAGTAAPHNATPATNGSISATRPAITINNHGGAALTSRTEPIRTTSASVPAPRLGAPTTQSGVPASTLPAGSHDRLAPNGSALRVRADGRTSDVHDTARGMDIHHNLAGGRTISVERADRSRVVYDRGGRSFVAHPYAFRGRDFNRRTYFYHGRVYDRFYDRYAYRGLFLDVYAPNRFYPFGFYGWAYNPWAVPIAYAWGFGPTPWYGFYGGYFAPEPVYAAPSFWLADFVLASSLAAGYESHVADQTQSDTGSTVPPTRLTPEVKQLISDEIGGQIALENVEAQRNSQTQGTDPQSSSVARMLSDGQPHVFIVGKEVDLTDSTGQECAVTDGDVLQLRESPAATATVARLIVIANKGGAECRNQSVVSVSLEDLQEMQNYLRETLDLGMAALRAGQGKNGLPSAPPSATAQSVKAAVAEQAPPPDPAGTQLLQQQAALADVSEREMLTATSSPSGLAEPTTSMSQASVAAPGIANIAMGQTTENVTAAMGQPLRILYLGPKTVYVYKEMKITFKAGKVANVE